jgi:uncharacterized membrane protein
MRGNASRRSCRPSTRFDLAKLRIAAACALIALIFLSLLWELWLAPLRPGGSLAALKALPLILPLTGILRGRRYTYQWSSMLILAYFAEGVTRAWSERGLAQSLAATEIFLSLAFFAAVLCFVRQSAQAVADDGS